MDSLNHRDDFGMQLRSRKQLSVSVSSLKEKKSTKNAKKTVMTDYSGQLDDNDPRQIKNLVCEMALSHIEQRTEKNINSLPDLVLRKIFSKFTLNEMFVLGRVCQYWKSFQDEITFKLSHLIILICPTKSKINKAKIMRKFDGTLRVAYPDNYDEDVLEKYATTLLQYGRLQPETIEEIVNAMFNVTSLTIVLDHCKADPAIHSVIDLLTSFRSREGQPSITHFHFYAQDYLDDNYDPDIIARLVVPQMQHKLIGAIDTLLPGLERFTWDTDKATYRDPNLNQNILDPKLLGSSIESQWTFVSRLRELNYYSPNDLKWSPLFDSVNRYATSERLECIGLKRRIFLRAKSLQRRDLLEPLYKSFDRLNARFYSKVNPGICILRISDPQYEISYLTRLFTDFYGLKRLAINFEGNFLRNSEFSIAKALHLLAPLNRLVFLELTVDPRLSGSVLQDAHHPVDSITALDSVEALYFNFDHKNHSDLYSPHWGRIFPSVQTFELIHICDSQHIGFTGSAIGTQDTERGNRELLRMFADQFPLVKKWFVHWPHRKFWTKEQLLK